MEAFTSRSGELYAENVSFRSLAETYGTPLYVYSKACLRSRFKRLARAMAEASPLICYSVKANSNAAVLRTFLEEGAGLDIVSGGELYRSLRAGASAGNIVFAGVGKTREEIDFGLREGILFFTVESEPELFRVSERAQALGLTGRVALRVNPDVDAGTHKHMNTGRKETKFGMDAARVRRACRTAVGLPGLELVGVHMHIGSQILSAEPFARALASIHGLCLELKKRYETFRYVDLGGGLGIRYAPGEEDLAPQEFAKHVMPLLKSLELRVILEPGRGLVGNAGALLCRVQYVKTNPSRRFVIVDAGMNDLIRPPLYDGYHEVAAVKETGARMFGDVVGPICESGDFLALERDLPAVEQDSLLVLKSAGAYGFSMSSNYNSRPRPAEVMVDGDKAQLVRRRETMEDLVRGEVS